jgi:hypothetical protein
MINYIYINIEREVMKKIILWLLPVLISVLLSAGCSPKSKYERILKRELASGVRNDTLFMGIYLGMPEKEFYKHCWELNASGLIRQSMRNTTVEYQIKKELKYPGTMDFYPAFVGGKIYEMPVRYLYNGWAPWNKKLSADSLQLDVLQWFKKQYGDGFMEVKHPERGTAYVKIDGNRQISIFKEDELHVWAVFTDMLVSREVSDTTSKVGNIQKDISKELEK